MFHKTAVFYRWSGWIGFRDAILFLIFRLLNRKILRRVNIANEHLYLRTATSDLRIAGWCLIHEAYGDIKSPNPLVIVDAGANIGASAIYFAKKWPGARVFAIEPERENYEILVKNTARYKNIIPVKAALWGQEGTKVMQDRMTGPWGYTISDTDNKTRSTGQQVDCITIGMLLEEYDLHHIDILKMDIEGSEKNVLENSDEWINKVSILTAELHDRICEGCSSAFHRATTKFARHEKGREKLVTAYRE